jgi:hypothetical protein
VPQNCREIGLSPGFAARYDAETGDAPAPDAARRVLRRITTHTSTEPHVTPDPKLSALRIALACAAMPTIALAEPCPGNPDALGTERVLAVNATTTTRVGRKQFPATLPLAEGSGAHVRRRAVARPDSESARRAQA